MTIAETLVTVVIPVLNDEDGLARCLQSLENQTIPHSRIEIIVVDNGSDIPPRVRLPDGSRLLVETVPGSYAARNTGIEHATAPVVALTDADCIPEPTWLAEGVRYLDDHPDVSLVGGRIEVFARDAEHRTPTELYEIAESFQQEAFLADDSFAATANLIVRATVFETIGLFNPSLFSNGDVDFGLRAHAANYRMQYVDTVVVRHPARRTFRSFFNMQFRTMAGTRDLALLHGRPNPYRLRDTLRALVPPIPSLARALGNDAVGSLTDRLKYTIAIFVIHYGRAVFRLRLLLGARSPR